MEMQQQIDQVVELVSCRAENLYLTGHLLCSEAVLCVLNRGLRGGLPEGMDVRLASALPVGMGNSGCTCGALSGAVLAVGLFLGRDLPGAPDRGRALDAANFLHDQFKDLFGSTCCRVLTRKLKHNPREHFKQCAGITAQTAQIAARLLLQRRPELAEAANLGYLENRDSWIGSKLRQLYSYSARR